MKELELKDEMVQKWCDRVETKCTTGLFRNLVRLDMSKKDIHDEGALAIGRFIEQEPSAKHHEGGGPAAGAVPDAEPRRPCTALAAPRGERIRAGLPQYASCRCGDDERDESN